MMKQGESESQPMNPPSLPNRPTLADLARAAGVSRMTVSRALRGHLETSSETRDRIRALADAMGYRPNPLVSAWMRSVSSGRRSSHRPILGWVSGYLDDAMRQGMVTRSALFRSACERAEELGFRMEAFPLFYGGMSPARLSAVLATRACPGLVIPPLAEPVDKLDFDWSSFSVITLGHSLRKPEFNRVIRNHAMGMVAALDGLMDAGIPKTGLVLKRISDERTNHSWTEAYLGYAWHHAKMEALPILVPARLERPDFLRWYRRHRPGAIIGADQEILDWMDSEARRTAGRRCVFVHLDGDVATDPRIFGVVTGEPLRVAKAAVEMLVSQINHNERGVPDAPVQVLIPCRFERRAAEAGIGLGLG